MRQRRGIALITVAGVFAIAASRVPDLALRFVFAFISVVCLAIGIADLGGIPCKERLSGALRFCLRCLGFYSGFILSIAIATFWYLSDYPIPTFSGLGVVLLLALAFALDLPTMYHGFKRRRYGEQAAPGGRFYFYAAFLLGYQR